MTKLKAYLALTYCIADIPQVQSRCLWVIWRSGMREIWRA